MRLGHFNDLTVTRHADFGLYLKDAEGEVAFLPLKIAPPYRPGDRVRLFVTSDPTGKVIATLKEPRLVEGQFSVLKCVGGNPSGAYMDWGLDADLFIPKSEQHTAIRTGDLCVVRVVVDQNTNRVMGTTRIRKHLESEAHVLKDGQPVQILVYGFADRGALVIVDERFSGMLFDDEIHESLRIGDQRRAYVKRIREDGMLALSLMPQGYQAAIDNAPDILKLLEKSGGFLPFGDNASPEDIRRVFHMSKGSFKKAIGRLYKEGLIAIEHHGIRLKP